MHDLGMCDSNLVHITRREYVINCNWKVFCDNYLVRKSAPGAAVMVTGGMTDPMRVTG